ncbi:uncharacterized protein BO96DRAFT_304005, partial [Aspergillus niger CBS 101883]|uniref:uncharacterized protein n=1 Tax=Aspergillus lacticoffeatus (strain CBS 101883) TaxID=1450533 RepID=UPI000D80511E
LPTEGFETTHGMYAGASRQSSSCSGFPMAEEKIAQRGGAVGHPLAQLVSVPAINGLRYNAQQPVMQDLYISQYPTSIPMSGTHTCSGS